MLKKEKSNIWDMISGNLFFLCGILTFLDQLYSLENQTKLLEKKPIFTKTLYMYILNSKGIAWGSCE